MLHTNFYPNIRKIRESIHCIIRKNVVGLYATEGITDGFLVIALATRVPASHAESILNIFIDVRVYAVE